MEHGTVTTDEELASLHKEVEKEAEAQHEQLASLYRKVDVQQKELLLIEEQYRRAELEDLILEEVTTHVTDKQRYQPQDDTTTRDRKDEPRTEKYQRTRRDEKDGRETRLQPLKAWSE